MNKDIITGIYKITNKINHKVYIGQSQNIFKRWDEHRYSRNCDERPLYRAFRKYGLENFIFEIIEICAIEELNEKEIFWIQYYDSYNKGYNLTPGGDHSSKIQRVVSEKEVFQIRSRRLSAESFSSVYKDYSHINENTFKKIWLGEYYADVQVPGFTLENLKKASEQARRLESASRKGSLLNDDIVLQIRIDKKNGMKRRVAFQKYQEFFKTQRSFDGIWYNQRWTHIQPTEGE